LQYLIVLIVVAVVTYAISAPLRAQRSAGRAQPDPVAELEAARDAKYREIRDAELDVRTGKLSDEDYRSLDATLRTEAIEILNELDQARSREELASAP
jgi:flagellar biosynthesis/type III secretory pathway M-ring protein FliF/YscJ